MLRLSGIRRRPSFGAPYNGTMNTTTLTPAWARRFGALGCLATGLTLTACSSMPSDAEGVGKRIERLSHEDDRSRIQELRVGGQTESIDVQPKNGAPAYQVGPSQNAPSPQQGRSFWRLFEF
jgi:hypothetical protein